MKYKFNKKHLIAYGIGIVIFILNFYILFGTPLFAPVFVMSILVMVSENLSEFFTESKRRKDIETNFPEFVRNLASAIKSGMPVSRAILQISDGNYSYLSPHVIKITIISIRYLMEIIVIFLLM